MARRGGGGREEKKHKKSSPYCKKLAKGIGSARTRQARGKALGRYAKHCRR